MPEQEPNPFEIPTQPKPQPQWGGMPQLMPQQGGLNPGLEGSYFELSPEAMQMMWAPQALQPQPPPQPPPLLPSQV